MPNPIVFEPVAPGRVVRRLPAAPAVAVPAPGPGVPAVPGIGLARSPAWQFGLNTLAIGQQQVEQLTKLQADVNGIGGALGRLGFPTEISVATQFSQEHEALLTRGVAAIELLAENAAAPAAGCAKLDEMSDLAFVLNARINTIAGWLMDLGDVSVSSVLDKLHRYAGAIEETVKRIREANEADAAELVTDATETATLEQLLKDSGEHPPQLFEDLNRRAALLLAAQCLVAGNVDGETNDWPPGPVITAANPPATAAKAAPKARRRA